MNHCALVLQSIYHSTSIATCIIQPEFIQHKCSISWEILSELHTTPARQTVHVNSLKKNMVKQSAIRLSYSVDHIFNLKSPKLRNRVPKATITSVSCPPAAGSQDHLTRTSLGELGTGSYQNLHCRVALPPLTESTDCSAEST